MKIASLIVIIAISFTACQKSLGYIPGNKPSDSTIHAGDLITYEVMTSDPGGWFGVWNDSTGTLTSVGVDNVGSGSPNYQPSGWTYSFHCPNKPFQALISVFNFSYSNDVTVNLYKNGTLFKSVANAPGAGHAKLLVNTTTDSLTHAANEPVLKYEVIISNTDSNDPLSDSWNGSWVTSNGLDNSYNDPLLSNLFPMPSGWNWQFIPDHLPFGMEMGAAPVLTGSADMTINYYVNGVKVKSITSKDRVYASDIAYVVN